MALKGILILFSNIALYIFELLFLKHRIKHISDRISYAEGDDFTMVILARRNDLKSALLFAWLISWTIIGVIMIYYLFFSDMERVNKLYIFIFLVFWTYFEILVFKGYLWRRKGKELIRINNDGFQIKNDINGYGKLNIYFLENISSPVRIEKKKSFFGELESSYWNMSGDTLMFIDQGKPVRFGKELNPKESATVLKLIKKRMKLILSSK